MAAPPAFSTYVAINQERQEQTLQLKRAAIFVAALIALAVVSTVPLYLRSRVVVRGDDVAILARAVSSQINANQEIAYRIAWETAPQRLEERARNLRLAPITKWEAVSVPGLTQRLKAARQTATSGTAAATVATAGGQDGNPVGLIWSQFQTWLGLGLRGSAGQPPL
jgi:hypothetical protein